MFTAEVTKNDIMGSHRVKMGTFSQESGDTGGVINTGLRVVENFQMTAAINVAVSGGDVTVATANPGALQSGFWMAVGM